MKILIASLALLWISMGHLGCASSDKQSQFEDRVKRLVDTIDHVSPEEPDGHAYYTESVEQLIGIGMPSLPYVLPLLNSEDQMTRTRAGNVVRLSTMKHFGWERGYGWPNPIAEEKYGQLVDRLGNIDSTSPKDAREATTARWTVWVNEQLR